jgi:prepilin-type processing-associated H-X9-DG protein
MNTAFQMYLAEFDQTVPMNGIVLPKVGVPAMYDPAKTKDCNPRFIMNRGFPPQRRLEYGALWSYMPGGAKLPMGYSKETAVTNPMPIPRGDVREGYKAYLCPDDDLVRLKDTGGEGYLPLTLDTSNPKYPVVKEGPGSPGFWSYSVNSVLNSMGRFRDRFDPSALPWNDPLRITKVKAASDFICFIEEDKYSIFNDEVMDAPAYSEGDMLTNRHGGYGNVGFADGHVEKFSATIFNHVPSAISGYYVDSESAMDSEITRMFFPDRGAFAVRR